VSLDPYVLLTRRKRARALRSVTWLDPLFGFTHAHPSEPSHLSWFPAGPADHRTSEHAPYSLGTGFVQDERHLDPLHLSREHVQSTSASPQPWHNCVQYRSDPAWRWLTSCSSASEPQIAHFHPAVGPPHFAHSILFLRYELGRPRLSDDLPQRKERAGHEHERCQIDEPEVPDRVELVRIVRR